MIGFLERAFSSVLRRGNVLCRLPGGRQMRLGDGSGEELRVRITSWPWALRIALDPDLRLGEAWMDGGLVMERGSIHDLLLLAARNMRDGGDYAGIRLPFLLRRLSRRLRQFNPRRRARRNVAHHYDLDGRLYDLFLDRDRQYSCAYFEAPGATLRDAQQAKKRHLAAKLRIMPGMKVLDIGCGWGGLAIYLAEVCGAQVTGITLSREQWQLARARVRQRGLEGQVRIELRDYRDLDETFDRIVSVGMFEHVGVNHYHAFFSRLREMLTADGVALIHSINRADGPGITSAWIEKYIFPGGYIPALSEVLPVIERQGLIVSDIEILRLHYAETLRCWRQRFLSQWRRAEELYDARFCRMWEFYLAASEAMFRSGLMNNFQIQLIREQSALPLTRDYIHEEEERLRRLEGATRHLAAVPRSAALEGGKRRKEANEAAWTGPEGDAPAPGAKGGKAATGR